MLSPAKVAVIIPCFNEAKFISALVKEIRSTIPNVIVMNDHSSDDTARLAQTSGAKVFSNEEQLGKGASISRGLRIAFEDGYEWALLMDGDGQHSPRDIPQFLANEQGAALVIGNRMHAAEGMPRLRRNVNRWMSKRISKLVRCNLPDTQCGFRLLNLAAWNDLHFQTSHFEIESEMVVAFARAGHAVHFVPIQVIYKNEQSKIRPFSDTIRWFRWYLRARKLSSAAMKNFNSPLLKKAPQTAR